MSINYKYKSFIFFDQGTSINITEYFSDILNISHDELITYEETTRDLIMEKNLTNDSEKKNLILCVPPFMKKTNEIYLYDNFDLNEQIIIKYVINNLIYDGYAILQLPVLFLYCDKYTDLRDILFNNMNICSIIILSENDDMYKRKTCILLIHNTQSKTKFINLTIDSKSKIINLPENNKIYPLLYDNNILFNGNKNMIYKYITIGDICEITNIYETDLRGIYINDYLEDTCLNLGYPNYNAYKINIIDDNYKEEFVYLYIKYYEEFLKKI
jgi:hypothetical protein